MRKERVRWRDVDRGPRPSAVLKLAAALTALAAIMLLVPLGDVVPGHLANPAAWWIWCLALVATSVGLMLAASCPWLTRFGYVPGFFFLAQAAALAAVLAGSMRATTFYHILTAPKYLALALFAITERRNLRLPRRLPLLVVCLVAAGKSLLLNRVALTHVGFAVADAGTLLVLAWAVFLVAGTLGRHEDAWAERRLRQRSADIADYNNPTGGVAR